MGRKRQYGCDAFSTNPYLRGQPGVIALSKNPKSHTRLKDIDIKYHYVRETIEKKVVKLEYCPTQDMVGDIFTKGLPKPAFERFRHLMGVERIR